jgi:hypothetical protein
MKFALLAVSALFGFSAAQVVAEDAKPAAAAADIASTPEATKQYVVSFEDEVSTQDFEAVSKWIKDRHGEIVESINENFAKLIIAKMDESISNTFDLHSFQLLF